MYSISKEVIVSEAKIERLVQDALTHVPSAFNTQCSRVVILFHEKHDWLWDTLKESLKKDVSPERFEQTEAKINAFKAGYGTVLFYEDVTVIEFLKKKYELYMEHFSSWSLQSIGMLQFAIWNMLELEGLGASLQHYNPFIEEDLQKRYDISKDWRLVSQMPFGKITAPAQPKEFNFMPEYIKKI